MNFKKWRQRLKSGKETLKPPSKHLTVPEKVKIPVNELSIGMYVTELDRPWLETSFKFQGFEIKTEADINAVTEACNFVYIDTTRQARTRSTLRSKKYSNFVDNNQPPPEKLGSFDREIEHADSVYKESALLVKEFMDKVSDGKGIDVNLAKQAVAECVNSVLHSPDAVLWLSQLKNKDEYTAQHSMNVCVLSIVLGRYVNLSLKELNDVGLCGMMHDMGKMLVPLEILNKPGKLEGDELQIMRNHTQLGYELLQSSPGMFPGAIDVAHTHHERLDKKGYPRQVGSEKISTYCRIVTIADTYDAITSDRVYKTGKTHLEAINIMSIDAGLHMDPVLVVKFIESLGVYPPGCLVTLNNGDIAIVVEVNTSKRLRPKIIILLDHEKNSMPEKIIDLSEMPLSPNGQVYTITGIIRAEDYGIDTKKYYQNGVLQKGFGNIK